MRDPWNPARLMPHTSWLRLAQFAFRLLRVDESVPEVFDGYSEFRQAEHYRAAPDRMGQRMPFLANHFAGPSHFQAHTCRHNSGIGHIRRSSSGYQMRAYQRECVPTVMFSDNCLVFL